MLRFCPLGAAVALALLLSGCFGGRLPTPPPSPTPASFPVLLRPDGSLVTAAEFRALVPFYDYILAAETHPDPCHHRAQAALLIEARQAWRDDALGQPVLALEMLPAEKNKVLAGLDADPRPRAALDQYGLWSALWAEAWGYPFDLYRPVFAAAEADAHGPALPVRGLNLPRRVPRAVMRGGLAAVAPGDRKLLPTNMPPLTPGQIEILAPYKAEHAERLDNPAGGSAPDAVFGRGGNFELVMRLWDNGMGQQAARLRRDMDRPLFILAGTGHANRLWGVPRAIRHYDPTAAVLTVAPIPEALTEAGARPDLLPVIDLADAARGDIRDQLFLVCPPAPSRARLGFALRDETDGLVVDSVTPDAPAARAGLKAGDRLLKADGLVPAASRDVHKAAMRAMRRGEDLRLEVRRTDGTFATVDIPLPRPDAPR